jgi:hypothetical protein
VSLHFRSLSATLAIAVVAIAYVLVQGAPRPAPRIERGTGTASRPVVPPRMPSAGEILDRRADLALTGEQAARLEALHREWEQGSATLEAALAAVRADFADFMDRQRETRGATLQEIQRRSERFQELSVELRRRRQSHSDAALGLLTESQRRTLAPMRGLDTPGGNP